MFILLYCLKPAQQVALMEYQWRNYGTRLSIPPDDYEPVRYGLTLEVDEIPKLMSQKPHYKGSVWRGQ